MSYLNISNELNEYIYGRSDQGHLIHIATMRLNVLHVCAPNAVFSGARRGSEPIYLLATAPTNTQVRRQCSYRCGKLGLQSSLI